MQHGQQARFGEQSDCVVRSKGAYTNVTNSTETWGRTRYFYEMLTHSDRLTDVDDEIYKVDVNWPGVGDVRDKHATLVGEFGDQLAEVMSGYSGIDIIKPHVTKAYGLEQLQRIWNVNGRNNGVWR